ncbi:MAG: nucleotidyltransferase family protein, partial [Bacteroidales bacterium]|nr:nucleotidyltransferase family protein [Bacteroidales bacterium]
MGLYGKKYKLNDLTVRAFLALTAAGLWGEGRTGASLGVKESGQNAVDWKEVDWDAVMQLAREQALVGILASAFDTGEGGSVAPGLGFKLQEVLSREQRKAFAIKVYSLEQNNQKQSEFIGRLVQWLETNGISPVLLKGHGVANSYRIPERRTPGDIDLLFQSAEYEKAKQLLSPKAVKVMQEGKYEKQLQMFFGKAIVELHGTMRVSLSKKIDSYLDSEMERMFTGGDFMHLSCIHSDDTSGEQVQVQEIQVRIPPVQLHAVYVFLHILEHLFHNGIGL